MGKIRIVLADDQALILDGIQVLLETEEDFEVVGVARDGAEAFELAVTLKPDIVLLDIRMPHMDGVESMRRIKKAEPDMIVLLLTTFDDQSYIQDAFRYGANGYLLKDISRQKLIRTIRDALTGETILPARIAAKLVQEVIDKNTTQRSAEESASASQSTCPTENYGFTDREYKIASLLAKGFTNKQMAIKLSFSEGTVKNTVSSIYDKINLYDRATAAIFLKEHGY